MIQFNLLPDVKLQFIKAKRTKHIILASSILVSGAALGVLILLAMGVLVFQKQHLNDLNRDIKSASKKLQDTPDLNKVLTVQNQLVSLTQLHNMKPVNSRIFSYLPRLMPANASIQKFDIDYKTGVINIAGNADAISTINKFADTLKFTTYTIEGNSSAKNAFSKVVLGSFGLNTDEKDTKKKASYQINLAFDPIVFDDSKNVTLTVPTITSTRSETEKPGPLFDSLSTNNTSGQGQ